MSHSDKTQVVWHEHQVTREMRESAMGQRGCVVWFTGLSGCGKSTVANAVESLLFDAGATTYLLDGDNIRHGLCADPTRLKEQHGEEFASRFGLGFSPLDREENIRRVGSVAELFASAAIITLVAFVSPYRRDRDAVRHRIEESLGAGRFIEVFMDTPLALCEERDPKGLYRQARAGKIANFTGISDPYEAPTNAEVHLDGGLRHKPEEYAKQVIGQLRRSHLFPI